MKKSDRDKLRQGLTAHVEKIAADLRAKMRAPGDARVRAEQLLKDERVAEDFEVWTDLLSRRAAVLWVLKSVYVRVLEDRGLLQPGRLLDPEAQQLFEKLAPNLGETAFLRWMYKDLASPHGGLPELFSPQPAEVALPSDELSRALIAFWRHRDADTGAVWSFAEERFEGELMGDLYQDLDPVVKDRFALCQTPDFVRAFILDRTLTPAIETFGADEVRLLDPACGSGHFLIDGLKRLVAATAEKHGDWSKEQVVTHALDRVVGIDLNDYACALARTRLIMTAAELAGVTRLADAARFHPHVYWADGLEQVERDEQKPTLQYALFEQVEDPPRATLTRSDVRAALTKVFATRFHAVVANPPYIVESDTRRKEYHKERTGRRQRYLSAFKQYHLSCVFAERCFQLAVVEGFVGLIVDNQFMRSDYGRPFIEKVLTAVDMTLIVDTSQAQIPHHGTATALLFAVNRQPATTHVPVIVGRRGEVLKLEEPSLGSVWTSIVAASSRRGFANEYVAVELVARSVLQKFPWSIASGVQSEIKARLEAGAVAKLASLVEMPIGRGVRIALEDAFLSDTAAEALRRGFSAEHCLRHFRGRSVRDWSACSDEVAWFPYRDTDGELAADESRDEWQADFRVLWRFRAPLANRATFQGVMRDAGRGWFEYMQFTRSLVREPRQLVSPRVASHNHFAFVRGRHLFNSEAPVIKLGAGAGDDEYLAVLGVLNSSVAEFWMRQVFQPKAAGGVGRGLEPEPWMERFVRDSTKMALFPIHNARSETVPYVKELDALGDARKTRSVKSVLDSDIWRHAADLREALDDRHAKDLRRLMRMVALQEELDWLCYSLYGIDPSSDVVVPDRVEPCPPTWLPWNLTFAEKDTSNREDLSRGEEPDGQPSVWWERHGWAPLTTLPNEASAGIKKRVEARRARTAATPALALIETANFKRRWYKPDYAEQQRVALTEWLADRIEGAAKARTQTFSLDQIVAGLQDDARVLAVCEVLTGRPDFSLSQLVASALQSDAVPSHRFHVYKPSGLVKREVWERTWVDQRREDVGEKVTPEVPPAYGSGDFLKPEYWRLRGKLDVPKERFIAFTEVPGRAGIETLYGWAGWTAQQRVKAMLAIDEELEDASVPLADRIGLLDSAWRLLPDVAREDAAAATRLKAELQALVGPGGPSRELIEGWKQRFPPPTTRGARTRRPAATPVDDDDENANLESE